MGESIVEMKFSEYTKREAESERLRAENALLREALENDPMDEKQLEAQSRLLIELGEPETWLETMLRASRRSALHAEVTGDESLARRWQNLTRGLQYAIAATVNDPITDAKQPGTATESHPSHTEAHSQDDAA